MDEKQVHLLVPLSYKSISFDARMMTQIRNTLWYHNVRGVLCVRKMTKSIVLKCTISKFVFFFVRNVD